MIWETRKTKDRKLGNKQKESDLKMLLKWSRNGPYWPLPGPLPMPGKSFVSQEYLESEKSRKSTHPFIPASMNSVCQKKSYLFISVFMCQLNPPGPSTGFPKVNLFSKEIQTFGEHKFSLWPNKNVLIQKRKQGF